MRYAFWGFVILYLSAITSAEPPLWTQSNTQNLKGNTLRVVCSGIGPSLDLARKDAIESCRTTAAQYLKSEITMKALSVESEKEVAFHKEVSEKRKITGLNCTPGRDYVEETPAQTKIWMECHFDLSKPSVTTESPNPSISQATDFIYNRKALEAPGDSILAAQLGESVVSERSLLTLAVIPQCTDLLVRNSSTPARLIKCESDPVSVTVLPLDTEIIVRSTGYIPKTIELSKNRRPNESVQVFLEHKD